MTTTTEPAEKLGTELAVTEPSPMTLLQSAIESGVDTDKLQSLMELQREWNADRAREAYSDAMSAAQEEMPAVVADATNTHTRSKYAKLEAVNKSIAPIYTKHGFSLSFGTLPCETPNAYRIFCECRHKRGHVERYEGNFPADDAGAKGTTNKTPIQAMGSTISYGRRYLTLMIFNIAVADEDSDGNDTRQAISEKQLEQLNKVMGRIHPDDKPLDKLLKWAEVESLEQLPRTRFSAALKSLEKQAAKYSQ